MNRYKQANEGIHAPEESKEKAARPAQKSGSRPWMRAAAAVLAVVLIGGAAIRSGGFGILSSDRDPAGPEGRGRSIGGPDTGSSLYALSAADYPETHPYPFQEDYFSGNSEDKDAARNASDAYSEAWSAWWDDLHALRSETSYVGMMDDFFQNTAAQFLTGAEEENRVCSPLNLYMALSLLAETTGGDSRQQILDLLQVDSIETLRVRAADLWRDTYRDDGIATTLLANSLWLKEGMGYNQKTLDILAENYYASSFSGPMGSEEYNQALRDWINEQTNGLLSQQTESLELKPETVLALVSTIYFKGVWHDQFSEGLTEQDLFHTPGGDVKTEFMRQTMYDDYYWGDHFSAVFLSFREAGGMWLILPDEDTTVDELLNSGEAMEFLFADKYGDYNQETGEVTGAWPNQKLLDIHLSMPKFDVSSDLDLIDGLKALGVTDVFDVNISNFEPLGADTEAPLYISQAKHAARVLVDEEGCEAAAYTVFDFECGGVMMPDGEVDFVLDRPFLFAITGGSSGLPLFTGVVNQPKG